MVRAAYLAECIAQSRDMHVNGAHIHVYITPPNRIQQLIVAIDSPLLIHQRGKEAVLY